MSTLENPAARFPFDNSYARLPEHFFARLEPTPVSEPRLVRLNRSLALDLGLDPEDLASPAGVGILAGNSVPDGAEPLAMAYSGFQFGHWAGQLGDGRALLLGELSGRDGVRYDVQLKGSGPTPFSRRGDGRAALGPVLREYILGEAMFALGIATTRSLAAVTTGENVYRQAGPVPGAVLTRVARSHVRVGTFEFFASRGDDEAVRVLANYMIDRCYPGAIADDSSPRSVDTYLELLRQVIDRQAELIASWQAIGFIHGVMNTDNLSIAGETIDYGPCAFMDSYHPDTVYSSIDHMGRYAYKNQPGIAHWNLGNFTRTLLGIVGVEIGADKKPKDEAALARVQAVLDTFPERFAHHAHVQWQRKLGLAESMEGDEALAEDLLEIMSANAADFTLTFRGLCDAETDHAAARDQFRQPEAFDAWARRWRDRLSREQRSASERAASMRAASPAFIPRNHLVEEVIRAAEDQGDFGPFEELVTVLNTPYLDQPGRERFAQPPRPEQVVRQTFCGT